MEIQSSSSSSSKRSSSSKSSSSTFHFLDFFLLPWKSLDSNSASLCLNFLSRNFKNGCLFFSFFCSFLPIRKSLFGNSRWLGFLLFFSADQFLLRQFWWETLCRKSTRTIFLWWIPSKQDPSIGVKFFSSLQNNAEKVRASQNGIFFN